MKLTLLPRRSSTLILDRVPARVRAEVFSEIDASTIDTRFTEEIYLLPAFLAALQMLRKRNQLDFSIHYLILIIKFSHATTVVGFSPLNEHHQQLALEMENVHFHLFQSGIMSPLSERSSEGDPGNHYTARNVTNYIFGKSHMLEKLSKQEVVIWGSLLNNLWFDEKSRALEKRVAFISQWRSFLSRPETTDDQKLRGALEEAFHQTLIWCRRNNLEFVVLGNPKSTFYGSAEADFYAELAQENIRFIEPEAPKDSYAHCQESMYIATLNSTLGIEMLGRGKLVAFWGLDESRNSLMDRDTLDRYFRLLGLDIESSCDLGLQLEHFIRNPDFITPDDLLEKLMRIQSPRSQATFLKEYFS